MGALVGGIYASGQLQQFEEWVTTLDMMEVLRLTDITISSRGLVKGKKIIEKLKEIVPKSTLKISGYLTVQWPRTFTQEERKSLLKGICMMPSGLPFLSRPFSSPFRIGRSLLC